MSADVKPPVYEHWRRNLIVIWLSQFFSLAAFAFALPFVAYFIQGELGVTNPDKVARWTGIFHAAAPLTFAVTGPAWGMLADRFGRRVMLVRANIGAMVVLTAMGMAPNLTWLIAARVGQGLFTGTVPAAQTLVAASTPPERRGLGLGSLSTALFSGLFAGNFLGGVVSEHYGYRTSFLVGGSLAGLAALLALLAHEDFRRPARKSLEEVERETRSVAPLRRRPRLPALGEAWALLWLWFLVTIPVQFDQPVLPLFVQTLQNNVLEGAAGRMGVLGGLASLAGLVSGLTAAWLSNHYRPHRLALLGLTGAAVMLLLTSMVQSFEQLLVVRTAMLLFLGGVNPAFQILAARVTPEDKLGTVFGFAFAFRSGAWVLAPLLGAEVMAQWGPRYAFYSEGVFCLILVLVMEPFVTRWLPSLRLPAQPAQSPAD